MYERDRQTGELRQSVCVCVPSAHLVSNGIPRATVDLPALKGVCVCLCVYMSEKGKVGGNYQGWGDCVCVCVFSRNRWSCRGQCVQLNGLIAEVREIGSVLDLDLGVCPLEPQQYRVVFIDSPL